MYIKTQRLEIKPYSDTDQDRMLELLTNETIKKTFMIPNFSSWEQAIQMFHKLKEYSLSEEHYEAGIYLENKLIGFVNDVEIQDKTIEMGYVIHPDYHNQGYATECLKAVIETLHNQGFEQVITGAFEENAASIRVMQKCGMCLLDKVEEISYQGKVHHCVYYTTKQNMK